MCWVHVARRRPPSESFWAWRPGASNEEMKAECRRWCTDKGQAWTNDILNKVFALDPVPYVRSHDFQVPETLDRATPSWHLSLRTLPLQVETLKLLALRALRHLPFYVNNQSPLRSGLSLPGELPPYRFATPVVLLVCTANVGVMEVAEEVQGAAQEGSHASSGASSCGAISIAEAETALAAGMSAPPGKSALLLYLNHDAFLDPAGIVAEMVKRAIDLQIPIALVHEQDPAKGACAFSQYFGQTPKELQLSPYKLYSTIATALYPGAEHRKVAETLRTGGVRRDGAV